MFDGLKIKCNNTPAWEQGGRLRFVLSVVEQTGEVLSVKEAKRSGLTFRIINRGGVETCLCLGSIHRYKNGGGLNNDSFTYADVVQVLGELQRDYSIDLHTAKLLHLEYGVNLAIGFKPQRVINSAIYHRGAPFVSLSRRCADYGAVCSHEDYEIKLYDKAYHQKTKRGYLLRIELRTRRTRLLSNCGVECLADLLRLDCWERLKRFFDEKLREAVFVDVEAAARAPLTDCERGFIAIASNRLYWPNLTKKAAYRARLRYARIRQKYGLPNLSDLVASAVCDEIDNLAKSKVSGQNVLNSLAGTNSHFIYMLENVPNGDVLDDNKGYPCLYKKARVTNTNKFNIKTMGKNYKKPKYFILTYGGKTVRESVKLEKWEINTTSYWARRVIEVRDAQTEKAMRGKHAIAWVRSVSRKNNARLRKQQSRNKQKQIAARARELARFPNASLDSVACGLDMTRGRLAAMMKRCRVNLRHELAAARASRIWHGYKSGLSAKNMAQREKLTKQRVLQIIGTWAQSKAPHAATIRPLLLQGLTQKKIAARLGVSRATINRWVKSCGLVSLRSDSLNTSHAATIRPLLLQGLTQKKIAARLGVSRATINRWVKYAKHIKSISAHANNALV